MNLESRIERLERLIVDVDEWIDPTYAVWLPHEEPPPVPPGVELNEATRRMRKTLMAMQASIPRAPRTGGREIQTGD